MNTCAFFRAAGDDAGFQFVAALIERFDAFGHRVLDRDRRVNRHDDSEGSETCKDGPDQNNVNTEQC